MMAASHRVTVSIAYLREAIETWIDLEGVDTHIYLELGKQSREESRSHEYVLLAKIECWLCLR